MRQTTRETLELHAPAERPLCLVVEARERDYRFELGPGDDRAIVVGSLPRADVRIDDPRVELVALHFERDANEICAVPAYGTAIEVNAVPLSRPRRIPGRALIEFSGHVLRVRVVAPPAPSPGSADPNRTAFETPAGKRLELALTTTEPDAITQILPVRSPPARCSRALGCWLLGVIVGALLGFAAARLFTPCAVGARQPPSLAPHSPAPGVHARSV